MKIKLLILLLVFPLVIVAQDNARQLLVGQVLTDSTDVENITVTNKSTKILAVTNAAGNFAIYAREHDTLVFSGLLIHSRFLVVRETDFSGKMFQIKLDGNVNMLEEVVIYRTKLTGDLAADSRNIKDVSMAFPSSLVEIDENYKGANAVENIAMNSNESSLQGFNFTKIAAFLAGIFVKPKPKPKRIELSTELFADIAQRRFSYYFFTQTLELKHEEIGLFLSFCDTSEARALTAADKEFELTDYLIKKSAEFRAMNKNEKN